MTLFARARELAGADVITLKVPKHFTVAALREHMTQEIPRLAPLVPHLLFAVNNEYATEQTQVGPQDEVACFPPVSGG